MIVGTWHTWAYELRYSTWNIMECNEINARWIWYECVWNIIYLTDFHAKVTVWIQWVYVYIYISVCVCDSCRFLPLLVVFNLKNTLTTGITTRCRHLCIMFVWFNTMQHLSSVHVLWMQIIHMHVSWYVYIYIHTHVYVYIYIQNCMVRPC